MNPKKWIVHDGSNQCPVPLDTIVDYKLSSGRIIRDWQVRNRHGWGPVVEYRIVKAAPTKNPKPAKNNDWIEHDGSSTSPVPIGTKIEYHTTGGTYPIVGIVKASWIFQNLRRYRVLEAVKTSTLTITDAGDGLWRVTWPSGKAKVYNSLSQAQEIIATYPTSTSSHTPKPAETKETSMRSVILLALSHTNATDIEAQDFGSMSDAMSEAIVQEQADLKIKTTTELREGLRAEQTQRQSSLTQIRTLQAEIRRLKTGLDTTKRARAYGNETENYVPWLVSVGALSTSGHHGVCTYEEFAQVSVVPADWSPKSE